jgi:hypothetical protein
MRYYFIFVLILALFTACGHEDPASQQDTAFPEIRIFLSPSGTRRNITHVAVTISAPDMDTMTDELAIQGTQADLDIEVPVGSGRTFTVEAYEGNVLRYKGTKTIDIPAGEPVKLDIYLEPVTLAIAVKALSDSVSVGDRFIAEVKISNVLQLRYVTFVMQYDADLLKVVEKEAESREMEHDVRQGGLLGDDPVFFYKVDSDTISISSALKGDIGGVGGSDVLAAINFEALAPGTAEIKFLQDPRFTLIGADGGSVMGFDDITVIDETVVIQ